MSRNDRASDTASNDEAHLRALGYESNFDRKITLWSNFALGFLYLSPLVGVIALFAQGLSTAGPPSMWWIVIVAIGQGLVALVFGEIVSQFPISGGIYQWARRLWSGRYAWFLSWVYIAALIIGITTTAMFSADFVAALFSGSAADPGAAASVGLKTAIAIGAVAAGFLLNTTGSRTLAAISRAGLTAELVGVVGFGLFLLIFRRKNSWAVLFDSMGTGHGSYLGPFLGAALVGLLLFYGFEACGEVAEETPNPARTIPRSMILIVAVAGTGALLSFAGYVLAAPDLARIVDGSDDTPVPAILQAALGTVGTKVFLLIALTSFLACVMGQQAAVSRLVFSFARDGMFPRSEALSRLSKRTRVPTTALALVSVVPVLLICILFFLPDALFRIAAFQIIAGYVAFQMVVLASLRARARGWVPAGPWTLGKAGWPVSIAALLYGVSALILLAKPVGAEDAPFYDRWIALIGFGVVAVTGLTYLFIAKPDARSTAPQGDAIEVADQLRALFARSVPEPGAHVFERKKQ